MYKTNQYFYKIEMWDATETLMQLVETLNEAIAYARTIEDQCDHVEVSGPYSAHDLRNV